MPAEGVKYQRRIPHSSASQCSNKEVCVLYAIVQQGIVPPPLHERDGLQEAAYLQPTAELMQVAARRGSAGAAALYKLTACFSRICDEQAEYPFAQEFRP